MQKRIIFFLIIPLALAIFVYYGVWHWAMVPVFAPPQGLSTTGTESELIRRSYPIRLVNPSWLTNQLDWPFVESRARLALISGFVFVVVAWLGLTSTRRK